MSRRRGHKKGKKAGFAMLDIVASFFMTVVLVLSACSLLIGKPTADPTVGDPKRRLSGRGWNSKFAPFAPSYTASSQAHWVRIE